jgi:hypothetical protein
MLKSRCHKGIPDARLQRAGSNGITRVFFPWAWFHSLGAGARMNDWRQGHKLRMSLKKNSFRGRFVTSKPIDGGRGNEKIVALHPRRGGETLSGDLTVLGTVGHRAFCGGIGGAGAGGDMPNLPTSTPLAAGQGSETEAVPITSRLTIGRNDWRCYYRLLPMVIVQGHSVLHTGRHYCLPRRVGRRGAWTGCREM